MSLNNAIAMRDIAAAGRTVRAKKDAAATEARIHSQVSEYAAHRALTTNGFKPNGSKVDGNKTTATYEHPDGHSAKLMTTKMPFGGPSTSSMHVTATPEMHNALEATER